MDSSGSGTWCKRNRDDLFNAMAEPPTQAPASTLVYAPKTRLPAAHAPGAHLPAAHACECGKHFKKLFNLGRHKSVCGTGQTQQRAQTREQNAARAKRVRDARVTNRASPPFVNVHGGAVRGISLTSPLLEKVCLGLSGVYAHIEPAAWLLIRCTDVAEASRVLAAEPTENHAALQHIEYLPRGACSSVAQGFAIKFEEVVVLRSPLAYAAHVWSGRRLPARRSSSTRASCAKLVFP
ncbi:hypothetical protein T492DRAFT_429740 [Pavlovales sp. CCMP2436]|nr:hypothetical protein T492DRAFT_429740 [Pavlovales sp. CCMP2436]